MKTKELKAWLLIQRKHRHGFARLGTRAGNVGSVIRCRTVWMEVASQASRERDISAKDDWVKMFMKCSQKIAMDRRLEESCRSSPLRQLGSTVTQIEGWSAV